MRWIVLLIVILAVYLGITSSQDATKPAASPAAPAATATPAPPSPPSPASAAQSVTQPAANPLIPRMQQVAQQTGVQLTGFQPVQQDSAWVSIAFRSDNKTLGADFIEALLRQGIIKDFDDSNTYPNEYVQNGTVINTNKYLVKF